ncbi:MAG TPA: nuclear transport factor 2 family protein [Edaphobacter sp.]|nr:nuclear transport factor 2 family protein [Edaphobacter sp.]
MTVEDTIRRCYQAYVNKDRSALEVLIAEDFKFTSPWDDRIDRATYFERCWPNSERIRDFHLEKIFVQGDEAFVRYELVPKEGNRFRNVEFFRVKDGKIREVLVYFGAK